METLSVTKLRMNLYEVVDHVLATGVPQVIERHGRRLRLIVETPVDKFANLEPHHSIVGDPDDLVSLTASQWHEGDNFRASTGSF